MQLDDLPLFVALAIGVIGLALMCTAFTLIARQGGWEQAMQNQADGRRSLARRLMIVGALLGCLFGVGICVLFVIPGGIPWSRSPPQWQITVENKGSSPCSIYVEMGYANTNSQGSSRAHVEDMSAGYKSTLISGQAVRTIRSVKLVRGEEEQVLEPNVEIRPGIRYVIVVTADGKVQSEFEE